MSALGLEEVEAMAPDWSSLWKWERVRCSKDVPVAVFAVVLFRPVCFGLGYHREMVPSTYLRKIIPP